MRLDINLRIVLFLAIGPQYGYFGGISWPPLSISGPLAVLPNGSPSCPPNCRWLRRGHHEIEDDFGKSYGDVSEKAQLSR
jgi:hypothetical protein